MPDLYFCGQGLFTKQSAAKDSAGLLLFKPWPKYLLAEFDETYSTERLGIGLKNEGSIPK